MATVREENFFQLASKKLIWMFTVSNNLIGTIFPPKGDCQGRALTVFMLIETGGADLGRAQVHYRQSQASMQCSGESTAFSYMAKGEGDLKIEKPEMTPLIPHSKFKLK